MSHRANLSLNKKEIDKLEKWSNPSKLEIKQTFTGVKLSKKSLIRRRLEETRNYKEAMQHGRDILLHHGRHTLTDDVNDLFKPFQEATFAQLSDPEKKSMVINMVVENISEDSAVGHTMGGLTMTPTFELDLPASPRLSTGALADRSEAELEMAAAAAPEPAPAAPPAPEPAPAESPRRSKHDKRSSRRSSEKQAAAAAHKDKKKTAVEEDYQEEDDI